MAVFKDQFLSVVEWKEYRDDLIFWKWSQGELKKGSRLVVRPGQDAIFLYNGKIEGVFKDEGNYEIESQIIPLLSTLKGFKFGFNSGLRAEVLFVNQKEFTLKWGTKGAINIPSPGLPGGMPVRAFGNFSIKIDDYFCLIDKIAGVKTQYTVDDVRDRVTAEVNQLLMSAIVQEGKDMFNLQASAPQIAQKMGTDLDVNLHIIGLKVTNFNIANFNYPEEIQNMINKAASQSMVGDLDRYQKIGLTDALASEGGAGNTASSAMGAGIGMAAAANMANQMFSQNQTQNQTPSPAPQPASSPQDAANAETMFCSECGSKISRSVKFCPECGFRFEK
ncbi:MAG: SPFH domain-containing protein [Peptococcaceae bacterium]|nr:SPFH domain-containing protein [Peptococcaceae bacterium]